MFALDRSRVSAAAPCAGCVDDPVAAEGVRQLKASVRGLGAAPKGEYARAAAAALHVLSANGKAKGWDDEVRRKVRVTARMYGRDTLLLRSFDERRFAAEAREFGVSAPALLGIDLAGRRKALDALLAKGITPVMDGAAAYFEAMAAAFDRKYANIQPVQITKEEQQYCAGLRDYIGNLEGIMIITCLLASPVACAFASGVYLGARIHYDNYSGCR